MMLTTTLNRIKACNPCHEGWKRSLNAAGKSEADDEPISYEAILDAVGLEHALWCCRVEPQYSNLWRLYAVWCARLVQHLLTDERSIAALDVAERHANGEATDEELSAAWDSAWAAAWSAASDAKSARATARAADWSAAYAAWAVADAAARNAARNAAYATWSAADVAIRDAQSAAFRQLVTTGTLPPIQQLQKQETIQ